MAKGKPAPTAPESLVVKLKISGQVARRKVFVNQLDKLCQTFTNGRVVCSMSRPLNPERN
ncbi:MAG: hypothetical protein OXH16_03095 [Gemmatimonadetes bacterium]|nr:hypothetical protein [Gemmatimonadota bacterium]